MTLGDRVYLAHILESAQAINGFVQDYDKERFMKSRIHQSAVVRELLVIGEASNCVSTDFQKTHPEIDWRVMTTMRNKLIHHYFGIDYETVWKTAVFDIPRLIHQIESILK